MAAFTSAGMNSGGKARSRDFSSEKVGGDFASEVMMRQMVVGGSVKKINLNGICRVEPSTSS